MTKYVLDAQQLQSFLAYMEPEQRGDWIMKCANELCAGYEQNWARKMPKPKSKAALGEYSEAFEHFWACYPRTRRTGKGGAYAVWKKLTKSYSDMQLAEACSKALAWQTKQPDWTKDNCKFVPMPETYLSKRRWEDEPPVQPEYLKNEVYF